MICMLRISRGGRASRFKYGMEQAKKMKEYCVEQVRTEKLCGLPDFEVSVGSLLEALQICRRNSSFRGMLGDRLWTRELLSDVSSLARRR